MYIDASALGELSSQLTPQDLETLVGFNIQAAELEALQEEIPEAHVSLSLPLPPPPFSLIVIHLIKSVIEIILDNC